MNSTDRLLALSERDLHFTQWGAIALFLFCCACSEKNQQTPEDPSGLGGGGGAATSEPGENPDLGEFAACAPVAESDEVLLIDDFEAGLQTVGSSGGRWISFDDRSGGQFEWETVSAEGDEGATLHVAAQDFREWSSFGVDVRASEGPEARCALDAKDFKGVRFSARGKGTLRVRAGTVGTLPTIDGGTCPSGEACYDQPGAFVRLTSEPQVFEIPFCGMRIQGWGAPPTRWDPGELVHIHFVIQSLFQTNGFEVWLDDLELYREDAAKTATGCEVGCPLPSVPHPSNIQPESSYLALTDGLTLSTFEQSTKSCGPLRRRYLSYVPESLGTKTDSPIVMALHGYGSNAESMIDVQTRGQLNALAEAEGFVVVYGNAAPGFASSADPRFTNTGAWRQATNDDREVDDVDYLKRVLADLETRELIVGGNDVFLLGLSNGGGMTLKAAGEMSDRLSGIALFMPYVGTEAPPLPDLSDSPLSHVLFVYSKGDPGLPADHDVILPAQPVRWAEALGISAQPSSMDLPDSVDEGANYGGDHPTVLATQRSSIVQTDYQSESGAAKVRVLAIERGGHFMPHATQDTEAWIIESWGLRNQDVDASHVMWEFFKTR